MSIRTGALRFILMAGLLSPVVLAAGNPFVVQSIKFTPSTVDLATGDQTVMVAVQILYLAPGFAVNGEMSTLYLVNGARTVGLTANLNAGAPCPGVADCRLFNFPFVIAQGTPTDTYFPSLMILPVLGPPVYFSDLELQARGITDNVTVTSGAATITCVLPPLAPEPPGVGDADTTPPALLGICLSPYTVDTRPSGAYVDITLNVTDDLAGFDHGWVNFYSPSGNQQHSAYFDASWSLQSGTARSGIYRVSMSIPAAAESGTWFFTVSLLDRVGNENIPEFPPDMPSVLTVISAPDTTPPVWVSGNISGTVDVSLGSASVPVSIRVTDDISGFASLDSSLQFTSPSGKQSFYLLFADLALAGTLTDGLWTGSATVPKYSEPGNWKLSGVYLADTAGNHVWMSASGSAPAPPGGFTVFSSPSDTTPPALINLRFEPGLVNTSIADQEIKIRLALADSQAGLMLLPGGRVGCYVLFASPSGLQAHYIYPIWAGAIPTSGAATGSLTLPRYSEMGTWRVNRVTCRDAANNVGTWDTNALAAKGDFVNLIVIQPSMLIDGTISSNARMISDSASNTILSDPGGLLPIGTTVAIDVLAPPPPVEAPQGFSTATGFVSITLSPATALLPPPGLTLTLPLVNQGIPGSPLALYKLDPATGKPVPAPKAGGGFVSGIVDGPLGQTATFTGIATFSTVVGLTPPARPGDLNGDGVVNCVDVQLIRDSWGKRSGQPGFDARADYNRDGIVNIFDLAAVSKVLPRGAKCW